MTGYDKAKHSSRALTPLLVTCIAVVLLAGNPAHAAAPVATDDPGDYLALVASFGSQSHWRLGETSGTSTLDGGPSANTGTYNGPTLGHPGIVNGDADPSIHCTMTPDYVEIPHSDDYLIDDGSVQLWFNVDALGFGRQGLFSKDASGFVTGGHLSIYVENNGQVEARIQSTANSYYIRTSTTFAPGTWHHIVVSFGAAGFRIYADGVLEDSDPYSGGLGTSSGGAGNQEPIALGGLTMQSATGSVLPLNDPFGGFIDEVAIFNQSLDQQQVQRLYGAALEFFTVDEDGTLAVGAANGVLVNDYDADGDPLTTVQGTNPGNALTFVLNADGSFSYTPLADFNGIDTFTYQSNDGGANSNPATATITVRPVNDPPVNALPAPQSAFEGTPLTLGAATGNAIVVTDIDGGNGSTQVSLSGLNGTVSLADTSGLAFALGDGIGDTLVVFTGLMSAVNNALDGVIFDPDPFFVGTAGLVIVSDDLGNAGSGGSLTDLDTLAIDVTVASRVVNAKSNRVWTSTLNPGAPVALVFELELVSASVYPETLTTLSFTNLAAGLGAPAELDADWGPLVMRAADGSGLVAGGGNPPPATFTGGVAVFGGLEAAIPPGDTLTLLVEGTPSLAARDGDVLDLAITDSTSIVFAGPVEPSASWPLNPPDAFAVDGMTAAQVTLNPVPAGAFVTGSTSNLALDFIVPQNGYEADMLDKVNVSNAGTAGPSEITRMRLWEDDGDDSFDPMTDAVLGDFSYTGSRWEVTGLALPVAGGGAHVYVTVDIANTAADGRSVRLELPAAPDEALGMGSGNDGPIDLAIANPFAQSVVSSESVVLATVPLPETVVEPGQHDVVSLQLVATNRHLVTKQVTRIALNNNTQTSNAATQADLDSEVELLKLRIDGNGNGALDDVATDPEVAYSFFGAGKATFSGLAWDLPPGSSRHIFVVADLSLGQTADDDRILTSIGGIFDIDFANATNVVAEWPLVSSTYTVDGMIAAQVERFGIVPSTVAPGEGPVVGLDVILPANGYADDVLRGLEVTNLGSAGTPDIGELRLWRDDGDGQFATPGDTDLGPLTFIGGGWRSLSLNETLTTTGTRYFVTMTVSATPADSVTVRLGIPVGGIEVESDNDGPIDVGIESSETILISQEPLVVTVEANPAVSTIGQTVDVRVTARNTGSQNLQGVDVISLVMAGDAVLTQTGAIPSSTNLNPGEAYTFTYTYTALDTGSAQWIARAEGREVPGNIIHTSHEATSNTHRVFLESGKLSMLATGSMPFIVNRGQTDVVPFVLTFTVPGGQSASNVRLRRLRLRLENGFGMGVIPSALLSRVVVSEGDVSYLTKTSLETSGSEIDVTLATPIIVAPSNPVTVAVRLDILPTTVVSDFRVEIQDAMWIEAEDVISGAPAGVSLQQGTYPVLSTLARVVAPPTELDVSGISVGDWHAGWGQPDVPLLTIQLESPGIAGLTTDISIGSFTVCLTDTNGVRVPASQAFDRIRARNVGGVIADVLVSAQDTMIAIPLSPLPKAAASVPSLLTITGDVAAGAVVGAYRLRLGPAADFDARDANTGVLLPVIYQSTPVEGGNVLIESPADTLVLDATPAFPLAVNIGETDVTAITTTYRHPGAVGVGRIRLDGFTLTCQNELRNPLIPLSFVDRVRVFDQGVEIANITNIPFLGDAIPVALPGLIIDPGGAVTLDVWVDVSAGAPMGFLELLVNASGIGAFDANINTGVRLVAAPGKALPASSGLTQLLPPATEVVVDLASRMPAVLVPGQTDLDVAGLSMVNTAPGGAGPVTVDYLVIDAADNGYATVAAGSVLRVVRAYIGGSVVGSSDTLTIDSTQAYITLPTPITILAGETVDVDLRVDLLGQSGTQSLRLGVAGAGVGVRQPSSAAFQVRVEPQPGDVLPQWTETGNFSGQSLSGSYSNFPNPFAAGHEPTTFVYYLAQDADVTLKIWTARGEVVTTLHNNAPMPAGLHQTDAWDGRNGRGNVVVNGVYLAELLVRYGDGTSQRLLRKVAVVR